jgi:hypothetical protein
MLISLPCVLLRRGQHYRRSLWLCWHLVWRHWPCFYHLYVAEQIHNRVHIYQYVGPILRQRDILILPLLDRFGYTGVADASGPRLFYSAGQSWLLLEGRTIARMHTGEYLVRNRQVPAHHMVSMVGVLMILHSHPQSYHWIAVAKQVPDLNCSGRSRSFDEWMHRDGEMEQGFTCMLDIL